MNVRGVKTAYRSIRRYIKLAFLAKPGSRRGIVNFMEKGKRERERSGIGGT